MLWEAPLFLRTQRSPDTAIAGASPLARSGTGDCYITESRWDLDPCVLGGNGHVIVRDGQETSVEGGLNGFALNRFDE